MIDKSSTTPRETSILMYQNKSDYSLLTSFIEIIYDSYWPFFDMVAIYRLFAKVSTNIIGYGQISRNLELTMSESLFVFFKTELIMKLHNVAMLANSIRLFPNFEFVVNGLNVTHYKPATLVEYGFR
jgi:hypothetical protein